MEKIFDPANVGRANQFYAPDETGVIRSAMIQEDETLKRIEDEIVQLVEKKKVIEEDLVRFRIALAPQNHNLLPDEILGHIFFLAAQDHGPVKFPIRLKMHPPQLAISHVCSRWRKVALRTSELWNNTFLDLNWIRVHVISFHQRWLLRAGRSQVMLSLNFSQTTPVNDILSLLQQVILPFQIKKLHLGLTYDQFMGLSKLPETSLSSFTELDIRISLRLEEINPETNVGPPPLVSRLRSASFYGFDPEIGVDPWFGEAFVSSFPWSQLQSLKIFTYMEDPRCFVDILRQIPMLQVLHLGLGFGLLDDLTMPALRDIYLGVDRINGIAVDNLLRSFTCPALTKLALYTATEWTGETYEILKRQYNFERLQEVEFANGFALPVSSILQDAPMLHSLVLEQDGIMDDVAIAGLSDGSLGRFLRRLRLYIKCDVGEILDMVEARKKTVHELIERGCTWEEEIAILRGVEFNCNNDQKKYEKTVSALKDAGITITF